MPAQLGWLIKFSTILIHTYINFRHVGFLGSVFKVDLHVFPSVYPHDIEHVPFLEPSRIFTKILTMEYFR